jgi:hypothetical protein
VIPTIFNKSLSSLLSKPITQLRFIFPNHHGAYLNL